MSYTWEVASWGVKVGSLTWQHGINLMQTVLSVGCCSEQTQSFTAAGTVRRYVLIPVSVWPLQGLNTPGCDWFG